jgi:hypothetical protein
VNREDYLLGGKYLVCKRGTDLPQAKLDEAKVKAIRKRHADKQAEVKRLHQAHGMAAIAKDYGVSKRAIERVLSYEVWASAL